MTTALVPMRPGRCGRPPQLHDCGVHGRLSVREIAAIASLAHSTVRSRLGRGVTGEWLLRTYLVPAVPKPSYTENAPPSGSCSVIAYEVFRIVRYFGGRQPTVSGLRELLGCSRATAFRLRRAWRDANGVA